MMLRLKKSREKLNNSKTIKCGTKTDILKFLFKIPPLQQPFYLNMSKNQILICIMEEHRIAKISLDLCNKKKY